jgi:CDP-glycerol glycerophosphotransferase (TagB/SpsB family)
VQPDLVVATSSPRAERAALIVAKTMGIPAVSIMDLFGRDWPFHFQMDYADRVLVMSDMVRDDFLSRGRGTDEIVVTGNPAFDRLCDPGIRTESRRWRDSIDPHFKRKVVLWTTTSILEDRDRLEILKSLGQLATKRPDLALVYRPHPNSVSNFADLPEGVIGANNRVDCAAQIAGSDVVLVTISTTGIEAALLDKPVIKMSFTNPDYRIYADSYPRYDAMAPYEVMGIAHRIEQIEQLETAIDDVTSAGQIADALRLARNELPPAGDSAQRVVDALEDVMQSDSLRRAA